MKVEVNLVFGEAVTREQFVCGTWCLLCDYKIAFLVFFFSDHTGAAT